MSTVINGLESGKEYNFYYGSYSPVKFTFNIGLIQIIDPETLDISDDYTFTGDSPTYTAGINEEKTKEPSK